MGGWVGSFLLLVPRLIYPTHIGRFSQERLFTCEAARERGAKGTSPPTRPPTHPPTHLSPNTQHLIRTASLSSTFLAYLHSSSTHPPTHSIQDLEPLGIIHTTAHETNQLPPADVILLSKLVAESKVTHPPTHPPTRPPAHPPTHPFPIPMYAFSTHSPPTQPPTHPPNHITGRLRPREIHHHHLLSHSRLLLLDLLQTHLQGTSPSSSHPPTHPPTHLPTMSSSSFQTHLSTYTHEQTTQLPTHPPTFSPHTNTNRVWTGVAPT